MRVICFFVIIAFTFFVCEGAIPADNKKPNVLLIVVDDLRPELGCYGNPIVQSPNIDKLAASGIVFKKAYCQIPVCGASRASILTGLRPSGDRFWEWDCKAEVDAPDQPTMNNFFKDNGYYTISNFTYTEWWKKEDGELLDRMLYDHRIDRGENYNVVDDPSYDQIIKNLSALLVQQFQEDKRGI